MRLQPLILGALAVIVVGLGALYLDIRSEVVRLRAGEGVTVQPALAEVQAASSSDLSMLTQRVREVEEGQQATLSRVAALERWRPDLENWVQGIADWAVDVGAWTLEVEAVLSQPNQVIVPVPVGGGGVSTSSFDALPAERCREAQADFAQAQADLSFYEQYVESLVSSGQTRVQSAASRAASACR